MSRKTIDTMRGHPGIPKKMRRSKKDSENVKKATPKAPVQDYHEVVFEEDGDGLFAMFGNRRMSLSPYGVQAGASVGETWRCMLDRNGVMGDSLIPVEKLSSASVPEQAEDADPLGYMEGDESEVFSEEPEVEVPSYHADMREIEELRREIDHLKEINRTFKAKADRVDEMEARCESKDAEIKGLKKTVESLSTQVKSLNEKDSVKAAMSNESLLRSKDDMIESQEYEIFMLREKLKAMGVDDTKVVAHMPKVPKAILTGEASIHCSFLEDGRYSVYVSPTLRKVRIVPDERGRMWCRDNTLHLRCIAGISNFEKTRPLQFRDVGDAIEIDL